MTDWLARVDAATRFLRHDFGLSPVLATEVEFYIYGGEPDAGYWHSVEQHILNWQKERGEGQYEIALPMHTSPLALIEQTNACKALLLHEAKQRGLQVDFSARPFIKQPGSGLHVHVHLEDAGGRNVFTKQDDEMSFPLRHALGGLLATMQGFMPVFAPLPSSRARFQPGAQAPTTVSWGANNRTTALRLPDSGGAHKRIEHRVAGSDADTAAVIAAVLEGIAYGLENAVEPGAQIHGDASLEMYGLPLLV